MEVFTKPLLSELDAMERQARSQLQELQRRYSLELEPLLQMLVYIESLKPPRPVIIDLSAMSGGSRKALLDRVNEDLEGQL